jgi:hypothetical protein
MNMKLKEEARAQRDCRASEKKKDNWIAFSGLMSNMYIGSFCNVQIYAPSLSVIILLLQHVI